MCILCIYCDALEICLNDIMCKGYLTSSLNEMKPNVSAPTAKVLKTVEHILNLYIICKILLICIYTVKTFLTIKEKITS